MHVSEIIFEVQQDEADGGYVATALGHSIVTQGDTLEELRAMVKDAVHCHFGDGVRAPCRKSFAYTLCETKFWRRENPARSFGPGIRQGLRVLGYEKVRQDGSPIRMTTQMNGEHHVTIPNHRALRVGTLNALLKLIATHHKITVEEVLTKLDL